MTHTLDTTGAIKQSARCEGWDGSAWRKLSLVFGYSERLYEDLGGTQSGAGDYGKHSTAVPAGEIHIVQAITIRNETGARGRAQIHTRANGTFILLASLVTPVRYEPVEFAGPLCLAEGDQIYVIQYSCLDSDGIVSGLWGYKMKIAE